ncbi:hypothetical protein MPSI1_000857 [Malassezia psittaci]|uniref:Nucleoside transporter n=1 Tax=Malassezia psittaci TaxID=1821823 RepID=A0AAF0F3F3_9BASI|nr:hypothetical protein MPSI1_000857 [Malassezia psittaci]
MAGEMLGDAIGDEHAGSFVPYFQDAFHQKPGLEATVSSSIMTAFNLSSVFFTVVATIYGSRKSSNPIKRVIAALYLSIAAFCILALSVYMRGLAPLQHVYSYLGLLLFISVLLAISQAYMQSGAVVICTQLSIDGTLMGYLQMGQALQGVFGSIVNFIGTLTAVQLDHSDSRSDITRARENASGAMIVFITTILLQIGTRVCFARAARISSVAGRVKNWELNEPTQSGTSDHESPLQHLLQIQKKIWPWILSVFMIFVVTLGVYPALTAKVRPVSPASTSIWTDVNVFVALHIVVMNIGDLIGRRLPTLTAFFRIRRGLVAVLITGLRFLFIPLFLACNVTTVNGQSKSFALPDLVFLFLVLLLGITTGCTATSVFLSGPQSLVPTHDRACASEFGASQADDDVEHDPLLYQVEESSTHDAGVASLLLSFWLVMGLTAGSGLSFAVLAIN